MSDYVNSPSHGEKTNYLHHGFSGCARTLVASLQVQETGNIRGILVIWIPGKTGCGL